MSKTLRETIDESMHKMGFYDHPVTIGGSTSYVDANSPFAKNNQLNNVQKYNQEVLNNANINPMSTLYNTGQQIGEFIADVKIAKNYKDQMDVTGKRLVNTFGSGQGSDIDNYYHPLLQCELSHISPQSQQNGIILGYAKEGWDYVKKTFAGQDHQSIINDSRKDLQNNLYGSNVGANNPNKSCKDLLDNLRTSNMRKLNIR